MIVAALQMTSGPIIEANLSQAQSLISEAASKGAKLIVLPECFAFFAMHDNDYITQAELYGHGQIQQFLSDQSALHQCYIIGGTLSIKSENERKVKNSVLVYDPKGECIGRYDKIHLFDVDVPNSEEKYRESDIYNAGKNLTVIDIEGLKVGISVCFDLRFPEMYRAMLDPKLDLVCVPSAFTKLTGEAHWETLIKCRAIENLIFMVAANQGGYHANTRETYGHSMVVDPWGQVLNSLNTGAGVVVSEINTAQQQNIRKQFPVLDHRKYRCHSI